VWAWLRFQLDANKALLRWLCIFAFIAMALAAVWLLVLVAGVSLFPDALLWLTTREVFWGICAAFVVMIMPRILLSLSRCARCSRPLFSDRRAITATFRGAEERGHHYQARTFLGSYASGSMLELARTGEATCMWCGHRLGEVPEYVVVGAEK